MSHPRRLSVISNGPTESVTPKVILPHVPPDEGKNQTLYPTMVYHLMPSTCKKTQFFLSQWKNYKCLGGKIELSFLWEPTLYISRVAFWFGIIDRKINEKNDYWSLNIILNSPSFLTFKDSTPPVHCHVHEPRAHPPPSTMRNKRAEK